MNDSMKEQLKVIRPLIANKQGACNKPKEKVEPKPKKGK